MIDCNDLRERFESCFSTYEDPNQDPNIIFIEAITATFGFNKNALGVHRVQVISWIRQLDKRFLQGWSFLNLPFLSDGSQWGEHRDAEMLYAMARGLELAHFCLDRDMWSSLPGGMPYIAFTLPEESTGELAMLYMVTDETVENLAMIIANAINEAPNFNTPPPETTREYLQGVLDEQSMPKLLACIAEAVSRVKTAIIKNIDAGLSVAMAELAQGGNASSKGN